MIHPVGTMHVCTMIGYDVLALTKNGGRVQLCSNVLFLTDKDYVIRPKVPEQLLGGLFGDIDFVSCCSQGQTFSLKYA